MRLLIDDMDTAGRDDLLLAMEAHPQLGLLWLGTPDTQGTRQALATEPETGSWTRTLVHALNGLPIESQLQLYKR